MRTPLRLPALPLLLSEHTVVELMNTRHSLQPVNARSISIGVPTYTLRYFDTQIRTQTYFRVAELCVYI